MSLTIWDHTVLSSTRHKWTHPALTPAYLPERDGLLSWPTWPVIYRPQRIIHLSINPAMCYRESNSRPVDHKSDALTTNPHVWQTTSTNRHWIQTTTTFCLINVSGCSTYSSVHCRWQSVSCCSHSSVEQSSIARHCCPPLSLHLLLSS